MLTVIEGDLFGTDAKYLCHQCNCVTMRAAHLAAEVFRRYPWADIYAGRPANYAPTDGRRPGDIVVTGDGASRRLVVGMLGQFYPGKPRFPDGARDGFRARRVAFAGCLLKILRIPELRSVAFPWGIGCGAAGGDWGRYLPMLERFAARVRGDVLIYRRPS
jgi:O-acetyl-ADP-ribose deacetylase (regulator of RNase III)